MGAATDLQKRSTSDALRFGLLWYEQVPHTIGYAFFRNRSHDAVIRVYDEASNVIEMRKYVGGLLTCIWVTGGLLLQYAKFHNT